MKKEGPTIKIAKLVENSFQNNKDARILNSYNLCTPTRKKDSLTTKYKIHANNIPQLFEEINKSQ